MRRYVFIAAICTATALNAYREQRPTFRSGVDLIAVDVQVVDRDGRPVAGLTADRFEVSIAGKRRRFIEQLAPTDYVGLMAFPAGPPVNPTQDHPAVIRALDKVVGQRTFAANRFKLRPSELIEISARTSGCSHRSAYGVVRCDEEVEPILARACGNDEGCRRAIIDEAKGTAQELEGIARNSLGTLGSVMRALAQVQLRKIVVLVSAGLILSGQPVQATPLPKHR